MMIPCELQAPPRPLDAGARVTGGPPVSSIRWRFPLAKKPTDFESGDQNGNSAFSVPGNSWATVESNVWTQSFGVPLEAATKVTVRPSGEMAVPPPTPRRKFPPLGGSILNRKGRSSV